MLICFYLVSIKQREDSRWLSTNLIHLEMTRSDVYDLIFFKHFKLFVAHWKTIKSKFLRIILKWIKMRVAVVRGDHLAFKLTLYNNIIIHLGLITVTTHFLWTSIRPSCFLMQGLESPLEPPNSHRVKSVPRTRFQHWIYHICSHSDPVECGNDVTIKQTELASSTFPNKSHCSARTATLRLKASEETKFKINWR